MKRYKSKEKAMICEPASNEGQIIADMRRQLRQIQKELLKLDQIRDESVNLQHFCAGNRRNAIY